jgi:hypothetical protein
MSLELLFSLTSALLVAILVFLGIWLQRAWRGYHRLAGELHITRDRLQRAEQELSALCSASVGTGNHVVKLEQQVQRMVDRQDMLELRTSGDRPYQQASQMVNKGADISELVDSCGLTRGEAELLIMMQRGAA